MEKGQKQVQVKEQALCLPILCYFFYPSPQSVDAGITEPILLMRKLRLKLHHKLPKASQLVTVELGAEYLSPLPQALI